MIPITHTAADFQALIDQNAIASWQLRAITLERMYLEQNRELADLQSIHAKCDEKHLLS